MNKSELISNVSTKSGINKKDTTIVLEGLLAEISEALANKEKVQIIGFGNFEARERAARKGRNPQTGVEIDINASTVPAFKPAKGLKDSVNK